MMNVAPGLWRVATKPVMKPVAVGRGIALRKIGPTMTDNSSTDQLIDFLQFLSEAHSFLKRSRVSKRHPDVRRIRGQVEEMNHDDRGQPVMYQKYESTFYEDAPVIVTFSGFLQKYECDQLRRYRKLTMMELSGLTVDYHPMAILGRSVLGTAALLLSSVTIWWGLIKLVSENDPTSFFSEFFHGLLSPAMVNRIVGVLWLVGMFVVVWYILRMVRNRKQVAFLSSLSRALELYLDEEDSRGRQR